MLTKILYFFIVLVSAIPCLAQEGHFNGYNSKKPVEITADSLEVFQEDNKAIFSGAVQAKQGDLDLRSEKMKVYYKSNTEKNKPDSNSAKKTTENQIDRIELESKIFISTPKETAQGDRGIYDVVKGLVTLEGNITLTSMKNIVKGEKLVYNLKTGQSKIISSASKDPSNKNSRVKGVFVPSKN